MDLPTLVARGLPGHGPGLEAEQRQSVAFGGPGDGTASQRHVDLSVSLAREQHRNPPLVTPWPVAKQLCRVRPRASPRFETPYTLFWPSGRKK